MRRAFIPGFLLLLGSVVLGATVLHPAEAAQSPGPATQLLFEQALSDGNFHELDASAAAEVRLAARGLNCPTGASFQVALYVSTAAGPVQLDRIGTSCGDGVTRSYEHIVAAKLDVVVQNRQLADGSQGSFPVDVAVLGRS